MVRSWHCEFLNVLNDQIIPSMDFFFPDDSGIFQDDNAKIHRALEWSMRTHECQGAEESFSHMNWPPQNPDFNPIESLWDALE